MLLIDVVTAGLSASVPYCGYHLASDGSVQRGIGLASFEAAAHGGSLQTAIEHPCWDGLRSKTLGIMGMGATGLAVARGAFAAVRAHIIYHHIAPVAEVEADCSARPACLSNVLSADALCVALPWAGSPEGLLSRLAPHHILAPMVFVAWTRSPAIERALTHLDEYYAEPVQLRNLALIADLSKFHFVRAFTAILGVTPHRYLLLLRLARATALLREGSGIAQAAVFAGFWDQSHFDRSFRAFVGMTPTQYQRTAVP